MRFLLLFVMIAAPLWAKESEKIERSVSLSSGYFTGSSNLVLSNSNRALSDFGQEVQMASGALFDHVAKGSWAKGQPTLWLLLHMPINYWITQAQMTTYHEWGHGSRFLSTGAKSLNFYNEQHKRVGSNPISFFFTILLTQPLKHHGACGPSEQYATTAEQDLIADSGGVNNSMRFSEDMANRAYRGEGHLVEFFPYLRGRLESRLYPVDPMVAGNDMVSIINGYKKTAGLTVAKSKIDRQSYVALGLSATTYSYLWSWYRYASTGNYSAVTPVELYGVRLPDVSAYFLVEGLSYKVQSGYRVSNTLQFPVAVEWVHYGKKGAECTLGIEKRFTSLSDFTVSAYGLFGRAFGCGLALRQPIDRWFVEGVVESMHQKSYYGQRNIPSLKTSLRSLAVLVRAGWTY